VETGAQDEIGQLEAAFNRMSEDLRKTTVSRDELEVLAGRLISAHEEERTRVARELHDDLVQRLAAVTIEAGRLSEGPSAAAIEQLKRRLAGLAEDVHRLSRRLHPAMIEELGLEAALESEIRAFVERGGPPVELSVGGPLQRLSPDGRLALFRISQEGLRNIYRHSNASEVTLQIRGVDGAVELELRDDGQGFDRSAPGWHAGLGLASMEERTRLLGGSFAVESEPGRGTRILARLPCDEETENPAG
jgi:signal transduction histidine kinase